MSAAPVRGVLFDAAGTLIRPRESVGETYARLAAGHGVRISAWRLDDAFRRVHAKAPPMVFPEAPDPDVAGLERDWWRALVRQTFLAADSAARPDDEDALFEALWSHYLRPEAWEVLPDALAALSALRASGLVTAVVSNFDGRLPALLDALGFGTLLDGVFLPGNTRAAKPDPEIFRRAAARLGLDLARCVYVGDHPSNDVAAALAVGMRAIDVGELATLADLPAKLGDPAVLAARPPESLA